MVVRLTSDEYGILEDAKLTDDVYMDDLGADVGRGLEYGKGNSEAVTAAAHVERI